MAGNVAEWTSDNYQVSPDYIEGLLNDIEGNQERINSGYYTLEELINLHPLPTFPYDKYDGYKIVKGGSWADRPYYMQASAIQIEQPDVARATIGFRTVLTLYKKMK